MMVIRKAVIREKPASKRPRIRSNSQSCSELLQTVGRDNMKWQQVPVPDSSREEGVVVHFVRSSFLEESAGASCSAVTLLHVGVLIYVH